MLLLSCGSGNMGYARSPTHIFPSVSVGAELDVVYLLVCVCVALVLCVAPLEMHCTAPLKSGVTVHPTMEE